MADNTAPASSASNVPATEDAPAQALTPEQQAMKARAERFGLPFNPNGSSASTRTKPAASNGADQSKKASTPAAASTPAPAAASGPKKGAIDRAPLGIDAETLAKRAAKFGLPEKKAAAEPATAPAAANGEKKAVPASSAPAAKKAQPQAAPVELTE